MEPSIPLIRRCERNSNLLANFRFFEENDNNHHSQQIDSTFLWDTEDDDNRTTTSCSEQPSRVENFASTFTRVPADAGNTIKPASEIEAVRRPVFSDIGFPALCVVLPLTLLTLLITGLVIFGVRKINHDALFGEELSHPASRLFILVDVSNSWLLSLSSVASTMAGYMAPLIMILQMYLNAQAFEQCSESTNRAQDRLLTPYQLSLMLGLSSGSIERWWRYERYKSTTYNKLPTILRRTASILKWSLLLSTCIIIADQVFHYTTTTVQISQAAETTVLNAFGRGLTAQCLSVSREVNHWWPCSIDFDLLATNGTEYVARQNEMFFLQQGISQTSSIHLLETWENKTRVALLLPQYVDNSIDFRASTIGVSSQCRPVTTECDLRQTGPQGSYTSFNCSKNFWGVLNKSPLSDDNATAVDPDVPPLAFKQAKNLQYGFFSDSKLITPYNTLRLNESTGLAGSTTTPPMLDKQLINPVYFAVAGSFSASSELAGIDLSTDPSLWINGDIADGYYLNFILSCSYQTVDVEYTSFHGKLQDLDVRTTSNGSIAEIYHGYVHRLATGVPDPQLQLMLAKAALQSSGVALANKWADLFSEHTLGLIGAFTDPRTNLKEQARQKILVTRISIPALIVLLVLNLAYMPFGLYLCREAFKHAPETDLRDLFKRLSVPGVITCRFSDVIFWKGSSSEGFDETKIIEEGVRVQVRRVARGEFRFAAV